MKTSTNKRSPGSRGFRRRAPDTRTHTTSLLAELLFYPVICWDSLRGGFKIFMMGKMLKPLFRGILVCMTFSSLFVFPPVWAHLPPIPTTPADLMRLIKLVQGMTGKCLHLKNMPWVPLSFEALPGAASVLHRHREPHRLPKPRALCACLSWGGHHWLCVVDWHCCLYSESRYHKIWDHDFNALWSWHHR